jgi:mannose-6-phosphate isomerase-like protein (cupin superfamily)
LYFKRLKECSEIVAGDGTQLRELLHPERDQADIRYSLAWAMLHVGEKSLPHRLSSSEVYYILSGNGIMNVDGESQPVEPGDAIYISPGAVQWLWNVGEQELAFLCIVDPAWQPKQEEVISD